MLENIYVKNFVLIDEINLDFNEHLNIFTGETGAGKSLIIDAISLLMGKRANAEYLKNSDHPAIIEAVITIENPQSKHLLNELAIDYDDDQIIVSREIKPNGKSLFKLNNRSITSANLKLLLNNEIDIHSQHDTNYLLDDNHHLMILDRFIDDEDLKKQVSESYYEYLKTSKKIKSLNEQTFNPAQMEFLKSQVQEIDDLNMNESEYDELTKQVKSYESKANNLALMQQIREELANFNEGDLYNISKELTKLDDEDINKLQEQLLDCYYNLDSIKQELLANLNNDDFDEATYNEIQERLFNANRIIRKYGTNFNQLTEAYENMQEELHAYEQKEDILAELNSKLTKQLEIYNKYAQKLHTLRIEKAEELSILVKKEITDLSLPNADFKVEFSEAMNESGIDDVTFMVSMNKNQPFAKLNKVASGGELNRLMLALKVIFTKANHISTVIFDEIDTGVSGSVAFNIGAKMHKLAKDVQVFSVTHLAPVACFADYYYQVSKVDEKDTTNTKVQLLDENGIIEELALITSGNVDETSKQTANKLRERSLKMKEV